MQLTHLGQKRDNGVQVTTTFYGRTRKRRTTSIFPVILLEMRSSGDLYLSKRISRRVDLSQPVIARPARRGRTVRPRLHLAAAIGPILVDMLDRYEVYAGLGDG